jgi:RecJ-like exonuclease
MASRDRYTLTLKCPDCGREGEARVSEAENPVFHGRDYEVNGVPEGFKLVREGGSPQETVINCTDCEKKANA